MLQHRKTAVFFFVLATVSTSVYLLWRAIFTVPFSDGFFPAALGVLLLVCEFSSSVGTFELYLRKAKNRKVDLTLPQIPLCWYPDVDVFIATHNEEPELLYKTVNACVNFDYPDRSKVHIYLCDDGNRPAVARLAEHFGVGYLGLANNKKAKSGNYNNALSHTTSPLVATFDADMIGRHTFLMETVPYFFLPYVKREKDGSWSVRRPEDVDPLQKIGLIQTPQSFYNPDLFQFNLYAEHNIPNEQDFFSREINQMRNSDNAIAYTGSNTLISRQALEDIGGFPTDTITEDFETGLKIQCEGYTCYATDKVQASGLATTAVKSMITQRVRWARGVIQSVRNCRVPFNRRLSFSARWSYMACFSYWWSFARRLVFTISPILFALFDVRIVNCTIMELLVFWLPSYLFGAIAERCLSNEIRTQRWSQIIDTVLAPYMVIPVFLETIGVSMKKFKVTEKKKSGDSRWNPYILPQLVILGLSVAAVVRFAYGKYGTELLYGSFILFWLVYNIVNLVYAVFFMLGRPASRGSERFEARIPIRVLFDGCRVDTFTENVSEGGLMFSAGQPVYIPVDEPLEIQLDLPRYHARMTARLLYVDSAASSWRYHCSIASMNEYNWRQYLQMVYDRQHSLPVSLNAWVTVFDDLLNNQAERTRKRYAGRRSTPRVAVNRRAEFAEGGSCQALDFNYDYLRVSALSLPGKSAPERLTISLGADFDIVCDAVARGAQEDGSTLLRVVNRDALVNSAAFLRAFSAWVSAPERQSAPVMTGVSA